MDTFLYLTYYFLILLFGTILSVSFCKIKISLKNSFFFLLYFLMTGCIQLFLYTLFSELSVWYLYPFITHLPLILLLHIYYRKRLATVFSAVCASYLCCQLPKWIGLFMVSLGFSDTLSMFIRIIALFPITLFLFRYCTDSLARIYQKDNRSVYILGAIPIIYYIFDYTVSIYTDLWIDNNRTTAEFLPFFLCISYLFFCILYYREYEQKMEFAQKEHLIQVTVQQQKKEIDAIRRSEHEIHLLRHDMRLLLNNLSLCLEQNNIHAAQKIIQSYSDSVNATTVKRYCSNDVINYILSDYNERCHANNILFQVKISLSQLPTDEIMFSTLLSNALENALHAQSVLSQEERNIQVMLVMQDNRLLLSIKNPVLKPPVFIDGLPVSSQKEHGYGTQSIRYLAERLGGNCIFTIEDHFFILRVII